MKHLAASLLLLYSLQLQPAIEETLDKYAHKIEHWLNVNFEKVKSDLLDIKVAKLKKDLQKEVNFKPFKAQELTHFVHKKNQKVINTKNWLKRNSENLKQTIQNYFIKHKDAKRSDIYGFLSNNNAPICRNLQATLRKASIVPWIINDTIERLLQDIKPVKQ